MARSPSEYVDEQGRVWFVEKKLRHASLQPEGADATTSPSYLEFRSERRKRTLQDPPRDWRERLGELFAQSVEQSD
jgi:hypothetical protein